MNQFEQYTTVDHAALKMATAGAVTFAGLTISEWAALAALVYSLLLIGEFFWKKFVRPYAERRGWVKPLLRRRASDQYPD